MATSSSIASTQSKRGRDGGGNESRSLSSPRTAGSWHHAAKRRSHPWTTLAYTYTWPCIAAYARLSADVSDRMPLPPSPPEATRKRPDVGLRSTTAASGSGAARSEACTTAILEGSMCLKGSDAEADAAALAVSALTGPSTEGPDWKQRGSKCWLLQCAYQLQSRKVRETEICLQRVQPEHS